MKQKVCIDIIILSYAKNEYLKSLTTQTIDTLYDSEDPENINFNVLVIESNNALQPFQYEKTTTIYPAEKFGFNKYLNIGINATSNKYLCLCNNDLIFHKGWAASMLEFIDDLNTNLIVTSPFCKVSHVKFKDALEPIQGNFGYFAGYCFFTTRETLKVIGELDEKIIFWYADLDFIEIMEQNNIPHYLIPKARVDHMSSQVTIQFSKIDFLRYTYYPSIYFRYKWKDKSIFSYCIRLIKYFCLYIKCFVENKLITRSSE